MSDNCDCCAYYPDRAELEAKVDKLDNTLKMIIGACNDYRNNSEVGLSVVKLLAEERNR